RTGQTSHHYQLIARQFNVNIFEVVLARTSNNYLLHKQIDYSLIRRLWVVSPLLNRVVGKGIGGARSWSAVYANCETSTGRLIDIWLGGGAALAFWRQHNVRRAAVGLGKGDVCHVIGQRVTAQGDGDRAGGVIAAD